MDQKKTWQEKVLLQKEEMKSVQKCGEEEQSEKKERGEVKKEEKEKKVECDEYCVVRRRRMRWCMHFSR